MNRGGVLITGAGGVVGSALAQRIKSNTKYGQVDCFRSRADCDLENFAETRALIGFIKPRYVFHLAAAVFGVGGNLKFPGEAYRRNIMINTNVIEACRIASVEKVVAMGSVAIYGDKPSGHFTESDAFVGRPHGSEEAYGFAKRAMLMQLQTYEMQYGSKFGYAYAIATNMYGPNDRFDINFGHVIPSLIKKFDDAARQEMIVSIWGDGTPTRDFLYSEDAANGLEILMDRGLGPYNLASGRSNTIAELVDAISLEYPDVKVEWDSSKPRGQLSRSYDTTLLEGLGFSPNYNLVEGIRRTVAWYREHRGLTRGYTTTAAMPVALSD